MKRFQSAQIDLIAGSPVIIFFLCMIFFKHLSFNMQQFGYQCVVLKYTRNDVKAMLSARGTHI